MQLVTRSDHKVHSGLTFARRVLTSLWPSDHSTRGSHPCIPEAGVAGGPLEVVLLPQVNREVVPSGKTLVTHVALVARHEIPLDEPTREKRKEHTLGSGSLPGGGGGGGGKALWSHLVLSLVVDLHGADGARRVRAAGRVAAEGGFAGVGVQVFPEVHQVFTTAVEVKGSDVNLQTLFCVGIIITRPGWSRYC